MKQMIEETNIALAAKWKGMKNIDNEIVVGDNIAEMPVPTDARRMNFLLIVLCTKGSLQYTLDTQKTVVTAGDMLVVSERHVVNNYSASPDVEGMAILMSPDFFQQTVRDISELSAAFLFARSNPVIKLSSNEREVFSNYYYAVKNRISDTRNRFRKPLVRALLLAMFYEMSNLIYRALEVPTPSNKRAENIFNQFIKLVESNFRRERRVGWYAEQIDITPKYLSETIKKVSQRTPNEWIDNYVVLELRLMLKNSTKSIKQITDEMNFPNQSFLGKFFKEHVGLSPTEYRRGKL